MENQTAEELKIPEEAMVTPPPPRPWVRIAAVFVTVLAGAVVSGYVFLYPHPDPEPPAREMTSTSTLTPGSPEFGEVRRNLPVTDAPFRPVDSTQTATETPLFPRATVIERTPPTSVSFTPLTPEAIEAQIALEAASAPAGATSPAAPAYERTETPRAADIDSGDDTVTIVAPITVTNTTHTGTPTIRTVEGLIRDIDAEKGVLLVGYAGELGTLVTLTPSTTYTIDGQATTFGALTQNDIVRVEGTGYADSASMTGSTISIIGTFEREPQGQEN